MDAPHGLRLTPDASISLWTTPSVQYKFMEQEDTSAPSDPVPT